MRKNYTNIYSHLLQKTQTSANYFFVQSIIGNMSEIILMFRKCYLTPFTNSFKCDEKIANFRPASTLLLWEVNRSLGCLCRQWLTPSPKVELSKSRCFLTTLEILKILWKLFLGQFKHDQKGINWAEPQGVQSSAWRK